MNTAFLSLGGNIGDRKDFLMKALAEIESSCGRLTRKSAIYETEPWGVKTELPYLNMAVKLQTALTHGELLEKILIIEKKLGRKRSGPRVADRKIDIDILFFNKKVHAGKHLRIPHPRIEKRKFVLVPLKEIEPAFIHPVLKKSISVLLRECQDKMKVTLFKDQPGLRFICVEGNIGSGKTTLASALAKRMKAVYLEEKFEQNNLLPLFYNDRKLYAFPLEYSFLIARYEQLTECFKKNPTLVVADFSFQRSLIFAKVNLGKKEFLMFKKHFNALADQLPRPDLMIHLDSSLANLQKNILSRGRSYELDIKPKYIKQLGKAYDEKIDKVAGKTLRLAIGKYSANLEKTSMNHIEKYIKENFAGKT